jgi:glycosyltransferase involved in cell wall biosynthesis
MRGVFETAFETSWQRRHIALWQGKTAKHDCLLLGRALMASIVYTGSFSFPEGDAGAARVLGIGKTLRTLGYEVLFGGGEAEGRAEDRIEQNRYRYQDFEYAPQGYLNRGNLSPFHRFLQVAGQGLDTLRWVDTHRKRGLAAIIAYEPSIPLQLRLGSYARRYGIPLILDITEWHTARTLPGGPLGVRSLYSEFQMRYLNRKAGAIIAISSFLTDFYRRPNCRVVRIPPLVDLDDPKWVKPVQDGSDSLNLIYAGTPGNKDLLGTVIRSVFCMRSVRKIELNLVGVTEKQAAMLYGSGLAAAHGRVKVICHGRIPQSDVPRMLAVADFSVLLRPAGKNAQAGFPTKLVESLSAGTPAIVNATSDIAEYLRHGRDGFIVPGSSLESLTATLDAAAALPGERVREMKMIAKNRARELFDYRSHCPALHRFLGECSVPLPKASRNGSHLPATRRVLNDKAYDGVH